jgi:hypothetical protein
MGFSMTFWAKKCQFFCIFSAILPRDMSDWQIFQYPLCALPRNPSPPWIGDAPGMIAVYRVDLPQC